MSSKKTKKGSKSDKAKRNVQTVGKAPGRHSKEEIISEEELDNRICNPNCIRPRSGPAGEPMDRRFLSLAQP